MVNFACQNLVHLRFISTHILAIHHLVNVTMPTLIILYTVYCIVYIKWQSILTICQEEDKCLILKRREELQLYYVYIKWKGRRQEIIRLLIILSSKYALQSAYICTELYRLCVYFPISLRGLKLLQGKSNKIFELLLIN